MALQAVDDQLFDDIVDNGKQRHTHDHAHKTPQAAKQQNGEQYPEAGKTADFYEVKKLFYHRNIVVIAPGKSSERNKKIASKIKQDGGLIISINFMYDEELVDYIFVGNIRRMSELNKKYYYKVIATSNIPVSNVYARIKYSLLLNSQEYVKDNSGLMLLKLLSLCECSGINVIGMDGYSYNSEENYYLNELELASSMEQVDNMNLGMQIMKKKFKEMGINFIK